MGETKLSCLWYNGIEYLLRKTSETFFEAFKTLDITYATDLR